MRNNKRDIGTAGEDEAVAYLTAKKYRILERNFRCKSGEIDIIAQDGEYIVFIEVKMRKDNQFGLPSEGVNYHKQKKIIRSAEQYLISKNKYGMNVRFDVIEIIGNKHNNGVYIKSIRLIKNAFQT